MSYLKLLEVLDHNSMNGLSNLLKKEFPTFFENINHGDFQKWSCVVNELPSVSSSVIDLNKGNIAKIIAKIAQTKDNIKVTFFII